MTKMLAVQKHGCFEWFLEDFAALGLKKLEAGTLFVFTFLFLFPLLGRRKNIT